MKEQIDKLDKIMETFKLSPAELAKKMGESKQTINNWKIRGIPTKCYGKLVSLYPSINANWLLNNVGDIINDISTPIKSYTCGVPYFNVDFMNGFDLMINDQTITPEYNIDFRRYNHATCWCNATGHSMEPEINNGDIVALKRIDDTSMIPLGEIYAIVTTNEMRTIKRLGPSKIDGNYTMIPTNKSPEYGIQELPKNMISAIFQVLGCMKKF